MQAIFSIKPNKKNNMLEEMETDPERLGSCDKDNNQFGNECLGTCSHPTVTRSGTGGEVRKQVTQMNGLEAQEVMDIGQGPSCSL